MARTRSTRTSRAGAPLLPIGAHATHHSFWMRWFRSLPLAFGMGTLASVASSSN